MKTTLTAFILMAGFLATSITSLAQVKIADLVGAWERGAEQKATRIYTEKFFVVTIYNVKEKQFVSTSGGSWSLQDNAIIETIEFNSSKPELVGTRVSTPLVLKNGKLSLNTEIKTEEWTRMDDGTPGKLSGAWVITGRMNDGKMSKMTPGARRTMKILSGTRFQWIAYNVDTKEFSGTGGGTYTTANGKYIENILFFSRDNNRVGSSLEFDFALEDGNWRHKGVSSKGDPIDEVWTEREKIGL